MKVFIVLRVTRKYHELLGIESVFDSYKAAKEFADKKNLKAQYNHYRVLSKEMK